MEYRMLPIGHGHLVSEARLIAIVSPDSAPIKRLIQDARDRTTLIDATAGRKTQSVLIMDSDHIVLSSLPPESLQVMRAEQDSEDAIDKEETHND
ncbi:MAG: extracellular matrix/biofilm biosynthesis regulator RemA family protein [Saccharofermentanales bacterium]|nr:DUF370 domain-containing protein [Eubacteriales bacterium]MDD3611392.1 DUF370 domain-containing protein [Eubacteriales bacterium]HHU03932.1 DUF370 domain-containing protein [Fastidiosipila sp.]